MWNRHRSLILSKISVCLFMLAIVCVFFTAPWIVSFVQQADAVKRNVPSGCFLATIYSGGCVALVLLYNLQRVLRKLEQGQIFIVENEVRMRFISWCCFIGAVISAISALYYRAWIFIAIAAAFMGLIVRVIKNIIAEAIVLKDENDYTI